MTEESIKFTPGEIGLLLLMLSDYARAYPGRVDRMSDSDKALAYKLLSVVEHIPDQPKLIRFSKQIDIAE